MPTRTPSRFARALVPPLLAIAASFAAAGCASTAPDGGAPFERTADRDDPRLLQRPFTADQLRATLRPGWRIVMLNRDATGERRERTTVTWADAESVEMEAAPVNAAGEPLDEPAVIRFGFEELRDHAAFPLDTAERRTTRVDTPLGTFDAWEYVIAVAPREEMRMLFAKELPGPPLRFEHVVDGTVQRSMQQVERREADAVE